MVAAAAAAAAPAAAVAAAGVAVAALPRRRCTGYRPLSVCRPPRPLVPLVVLAAAARTQY